ncbi:hypothetical protein [Bacillus benzoevorans]|uniref:Uncharacterized protein n=1 Tax=Bacillus benzoevorans TaxID=1456 RepID=A0A7X0HTH2_9BACI|nr:hypothetical protein [Bacillus benzoevorans]MBB6446491.1 hypothetical protein [Bacillus benzoevorans]
MANQTMLRICHLLNQCDGCERKIPNRQVLKKEVHARLCTGCQVYERFAQLRPLIDDNKPELLKRILAKGEDMTTSEIAYLVKQNVRKSDIREALGMSDTSFRKMLQYLGLSKHRVVSG